MIKQLKIFYKNHLWAGRSILTVIIFSLLIISLRVALSPGIIYGTTSWLKKQGVTSSIEDIDINLLDGSVSLINAEGSKNGKTIFNINLIRIHWQWSPLSDKIIDITQIIIDGFSVDIKLYTNSITVSGVQFPLGDDTTAVSEKNQLINQEASSWAASLGKVIFTNLDICYLQHNSTYENASETNKLLDYCARLDKMKWGGTIQYGTDKTLLKKATIPLSSTGNFALTGLTVTDNRLGMILLSSADNTVKNVVIQGLNNIHIDSLNMKSLSLLQRDDAQHKDSIRFQQLIVNDISLTDMNTLTINSISVDDPGFYLVKHEKNKWEYEQWLPAFPDDLQTTATTKNKKSAKSGDDKTATFSLSIDSVAITNSDLCYLDKKTSVYYCLTFTSFNWAGPIRYDNGIAIKGDLSLTDSNIRNMTIERDLLDFKSLSLSKLNITGADLISLDKLILTNLKALQRDNTKNDFTISINTIDIENFKYTDNNIDINTINLDGLSNTVSKNKDGSWEHDKWLSKTDQNTDQNTDKKTSDKTKEPLVLSLNKITINTDQKIQFIDNSTVPVMKIGLQKLTVEASQLYSKKPDIDSPVKLFAKTTRHGTIDIKGTVRPFADKLSFNAKGVLKGFDLRAATPATKKAIGHVIQSGQLDADLNLLAKNGILDSSIDLTLFHFNIKAVSSKDAEKFDKQFGMPLNQTLVLLRNKDDSINLSIPITGDIHNPSFDPTDAIIKATSKAAAVTLITFYTPYGLAYAGGNLAFNLATALNFDPVNFEAGSAELNENSKQQLNALAELLNAKPGVHLTLCGITNQQDVASLYPKNNKQIEKSTNENDDNPSAAKLTAKQITDLNKIAMQRQVNSKNYLVKQHNIEHSRLILCAPEHKADEDNLAGVEIKI